MEQWAMMVPSLCKYFAKVPLKFKKHLSQSSQGETKTKTKHHNLANSGPV